MKIVFAASEASPFVKTGGLGDVAGALPAALSRDFDTEVFLFLPYYGSVKNDPRIQTQFLDSFSLTLSWRVQHIGVFRLTPDTKRYHVYFIDNEYYFGKDGAYGYCDDGERFSYFSKAVLESLVHLGIRPDIIHANDWQTAPIPVFLHAFYESTLGAARTVFTIHNIEYQGKCDKSFISDVLGLGEEFFDTLTFDNMTNLLKGAILTCDALTTVSGTYADEICCPYFAHGLSSVISDHAFKLRGITNGIDTKRFDPSNDTALTLPFDTSTTADGKRVARDSVRRELGLSRERDVPMIGIVSRLASHKGIALLCEVIGELMGWELQLTVLGTGESEYENRLLALSNMQNGKFAFVRRFDEGLASRIYAASDFYLMPSRSEPCGLSQLIAMRYGAIPIVHAIGGLRDTVEPYNTGTGTGTGFTFQSFCASDMLDAIRRAFTVYGGDRKNLSRLIENCMTRDSSWDVPAKAYKKLYSELISKNKTDT